MSERDHRLVNPLNNHVINHPAFLPTLSIGKISFGGIPNSSSLLPCLTTWAHSCSAMVLPMWTMSSPKGVQKQSHSCSCQGCKARNHTGTLLNLPKHWNSPEPSGTFRKLPPEPTPAHTGTLRNVPEVASRTYMEPSGTFRKLPPEATPAHTGTLRNLVEVASRTYTSTHWTPPERSGSCLWNLHGTLRNLPEVASGTFRNLPEVASGSYTSTHWNPPEPSGSCLQNLHQHTLEPSGTFRKLPLEPTWNPPEPSGSCLRNLHQHTLKPSGTFRKLPLEPTWNPPEPSGSCLRNLHQHTPELSGTFWPSGTFLRNLLLRPAPAHTGAYLG